MFRRKKECLRGRKFSRGLKEYKLFSPSHTGSFSDPNYPVETVSWTDAVNYCNWLSDQTGWERCYDGSYNVDITKKGYRLPTEAEWEYSCRGGEIVFNNYYWDGMVPNTIGDYCWYNVNSGSHPNVVGTKSPNNFGLFDMSGNVFEWINDWYGSYSDTTQTDPIGNSSGSNRILRGGGWANIANRCRSAYRGYGQTSEKENYIGFRIVRTK
ncbi:MAG: SUMF1/EgtB/PvdO family nonheme iron enzyme [Candidatus Eremiobacterota bacterium]